MTTSSANLEHLIHPLIDPMSTCLIQTQPAVCIQFTSGYTNRVLASKPYPRLKPRAARLRQLVGISRRRLSNSSCWAYVLVQWFGDASFWVRSVSLRLRTLTAAGLGWLCDRSHLVRIRILHQGGPATRFALLVFFVFCTSNWMSGLSISSVSVQTSAHLALMCSSFSLGGLTCKSGVFIRPVNKQY